MHKTAEQIATAVLTKISSPSDTRITRAFLTRLEKMMGRDPTFAWRTGPEILEHPWSRRMTEKTHNTIKNTLATPLERYRALEPHPQHLPSVVKQLKQRIDDNTLVQSRVIHPHDLDYPERFRVSSPELYPGSTRPLTSSQG